MEQYDLPLGWVLAKLGEVAKFINGRAFKPSEWELEGLPIIRIQNLTNPSAPIHYFSHTVDERYRVYDGDLLISWSATIDVFIWTRGLAILNQHIFKVSEFSEIITRKYLYYAVRAVLETLREQSHGTGMQHITRVPFEATQIPLPPLAEQHRIVAQIDGLFAELRAAREALDALPTLLKQFRQSVLAAAFRGELTERTPDDEPASVLIDRIHVERRAKWEADLRAKGKDPDKYPYEEPAAPDTEGLPELPEGWVWASMGDLIDYLQYGSSVKADADVVTGIPVLRMGNLQDGSIVYEGLKYIHPSKENIERYLLDTNDILINRTNSPELVGKAALVEQSGGYIFASYIIRIKIKQSKAIPKYVTLFINSHIAREHVAKVKHQVAGQANINSEDIRTMPVALAPYSEQYRIAWQIENIEGDASALANTIESVSRQIDTLEQSILARAFRGELVPQDPDDEPASALLERIRQSREDAPPRKAQRRKKE